MQSWYDGRESTEEATGPLFRSHPTEKRYLSEGLGTFSTEYTKTSPKRTWFLLLTKLCAALRVSSQFNFAELYVHTYTLNCSDYPENLRQNRMRGIRSYNKVCKFLDSSKTHAPRRQHEPKKYNIISSELYYLALCTDCRPMMLPHHRPAVRAES